MLHVLREQRSFRDVFQSFIIYGIGGFHRLFQSQICVWGNMFCERGFHLCKGFQ